MAVGSEGFVETIKGKIGYRVKGLKVAANESGFQLREEIAFYNADNGDEKGDIGGENNYFWYG